jgi:glc operon protein GlcG
MRLLGYALAASAALAAPAGAKIEGNRWIDSADAARLTDACVALAARSGWKVHVAVLNGHGDLIRFVGMDGATRTSGVFALEKARTVFRTGRATRDVAKMDPNAHQVFNAVTLAGGMPVMVDGRLVGTVGVSGAKPDDDEACANAGIAAAM